MGSVGQKRLIYLDKRRFLGQGHMGCVFGGSFEKIDVAIKRIQNTENRSRRIDEEIEKMRSLEHDNIIRYRFSDYDKNFVYIAMSLCHGTLHDLVADNTETNLRFPEDMDPCEEFALKIKLLNDVAQGLNYLHVTANIVHRDLTPRNVLIKNLEITQDDSCMRALISDFGLSLQLKEDASSVTASQPHAGTSGWKPKELLNEETTKIKKDADIFAYGCLVHYTLSTSREDGYNHPFGKRIYREGNIVDDKRSSYLYLNCPGREETSFIQTDLFIGDILVDLCVISEPSHRLTSTEILKQPLFWNSDKKMEFVVKAFEAFNTGKRYRKAPEIKYLEDHWIQSKIEKDAFISRIFPEFWATRIKKWKKVQDSYKNSIFFLMRLVRNCKAHYSEDREALQNVLGEGRNEDFVGYFFGRIPHLFPLIYFSFYRVEELQEYYCGMSDVVESKIWSTICHLQELPDEVPGPSNSGT